MMAFCRKFCGNMKVLFALLPLFFTLIEADSDCNYFENLETENSHYAYNPNYPNLDYGPMHCKWQMVYSGIIKINCSFDIPASTNCISDSLSIKFAEENVVHKYCDSNTLDIEGINATISFDLSNLSKGSKFLCEIRAEKQFDENNCKCGWKKVTRIVGGTETGINEYPMMCGLVDITNKMIYCGCTIISKHYVLTAAHCIETVTRSVTKIGVVVGEHDVTTGKETNATKLFLIINCKMHPDYKDIHNDLAVCKINGTIKYDDDVGPVCLPFQHKRDSFGGVIAEALGWGLLKFGGEKTENLQKVSLNVIQNKKCRQSIPEVTNKNLCTFTPGKDTCQMDSGGPLLWENPTTHNVVIIGIISFGFGCASDEPAVETRVGAYIDWIKNVTFGEQYCKIE